jgi:Fe-S oxidoreductase
MDTHLRFEENQETPEFDTYLDFSGNQGILRAAEQCNGSGDCRKTHITGGTMCPSYMATRREKDTTRARANILREYLTRSDKPNRFNHEEIKEVMDLCLSCKGCKSECPSNVDVGKMKAEFLQQYYEANGIPFRSRLIANFTRANKLASLVPWAYNFVVNTKPFSTWIKQLSGFHPARSLPTLGKQTLYSWYSKHQQQGIVAAKGVTLSGKNPDTIQLDKRPEVKPPKGKVYVFCDEFSNFNDVEIGIKTIRVLEQLGYEVEVPRLEESGRTYLSKGLLKQARIIARKNVKRLQDKVSEETPIIGIEPSAILSLRDEYIDLLRGEEQEAARKVAENTLLFEEFIAREMDTGNISSDQFTDKEQVIKLHGHCHQKALSGLVPTKKALSLPANYQVHLIRSGCCGMAGSFGYEKEHYELSMNIGELVLFPKVREQNDDVIIAAPGTSCRHQIKDGTGRIARHPAEILFDALKK